MKAYILFIKKLINSKYFAPILSGLLAFVLYLIIWEAKYLNPYFLGLVNIGGDIGQHIVGFIAYLHNGIFNDILSENSLSSFKVGDIFFPFGLSDNLMFPDKYSIYYTDSIPIFALIFRALSFLFSADFQYMGIYVAVILFLQAFFAALIIQFYTNNRFIIILSSLLLLLSFPMFWRTFGHTALASHYLILAIIAYIIYNYQQNNYKKDAILLSIILSIAGLTHGYFIPMVFILSFFYICYKLILFKNFKFLLSLGISLSSLALILILFGATYNVENTNAGTVKHFIANLNTFFNSLYTRSAFNIHFPVATSGSYEGASYMGMGNILLVLIALIIFLFNFIRNFKIKSDKMVIIKNLLILLALLSFLILSTGGNFTFNDKEIFLINFDSLPVIKSFHSVGRFSWVVMYSLIILSIVYLIRFFNNYGLFAKRIFISLIIFFVVMQSYDISLFLKNKRMSLTDYNSKIDSKTCNNLKKTGFKFVVIDSSISYSLTSPTMYLDLYKCGFPVTNFYIARPPSKMLSEKIALFTFNMLSHNDEDAKSDYVAQLDNIYNSLKKSQKYKRSKVFENLPFYLDTDNYFIISEKPFKIDNVNNLFQYKLGDRIILTNKQLDYLEKLDVNISNKRNILVANQYLHNGKFINSGPNAGVERVLFKDGVSFGPYEFFRQGKYKVVVEGNNLDKIDLSINSNMFKVNQGNFDYIERSSDRLEVHLSIPITSLDWEFLLRNISSSNVLIKNAEVFAIE